MKIERNIVKEKLAAGKPAVGTWLSLCSPQAAEALAHLGWDWLVVDAQHSPVGFETIVHCFRAIQLGGAAPMARVPWNNSIWIQRLLDAGAMGLVVPVVNSAEEARQVVASFKYAPQGMRSWGGSRIAAYVGEDYFTWAQRELVVIVMIETAQAVREAEEILAVEGVDGCFIGPSDLAASLGFHPSSGPQHPEHEEAIMQVLAAAKKTRKAAGIHCYSPESVNARIQQGFQFLALNSDARFMMASAQESFRRLELPK